MAIVARIQDPILSNTNSITKNLSSLQFDNFLTEDEKNLMHLRPRSNLMLVTQCALTTVIVNILKTAKRFIFENQDPTKGKEKEQNQFSVGIIGCGRLGSEIAQILLTYGQLQVSSLQISTRRPDLLGELSSKGVQCYFDNKRLISTVDVAILCVLPSQVPTVAHDIKSLMLPSHILLCPFSSMSLPRLQKLLGTDNLLPFGLHCSDIMQDGSYNFMTVSKALESKSIVQGTCPLGINKQGLMVSTDESVAEIIILAVANLCTAHKCTIDQTLDVISLSVFGDNEKKKAQHLTHLTCEDFGLCQENSSVGRTFPHFNLLECYKKGTKLLTKLKANESLQTAFSSRYWHIFDDYIYKLSFGHLQ